MMDDYRPSALTMELVRRGLGATGGAVGARDTKPAERYGALHAGVLAGAPGGDQSTGLSAGEGGPQPRRIGSARAEAPASDVGTVRGEPSPAETEIIRRPVLLLIVDNSRCMGAAQPPARSPRAVASIHLRLVKR